MLEVNLKNATTDEQVKEAIYKAFDQLEAEWKEVAKITFDKGFATTAYVSSTALVAIVHDNKLFVANSGDSKAVLLRKKGDDDFEQINLSKTFSINNKAEQARMKKAFPGEKDIFTCMKGPVGEECYVKGGL